MNIKGKKKGNKKKEKKKREKKEMVNVKGTRVHGFENNFVFQKSTVNVLYEQTIIEEKG